MRGLTMRGLTLRTVRRALARKGMMRAFAALVCVSFSGSPRSNPIAFAVDQPPIIVIDTPNDSLWLKRVMPQIVVSDDTDPTPSFTAELNNQPYQPGTPITQAGLYELRIIARDASGNVSEETVHFQVLDEPHYTGTLSLVEWSWQTAGGYAGLDAWIILKGPFRPDNRLKSIANYPETIPVCVIFPTHLSLKVVDTEGNSMTINQILPLYADKCEHPPAVRLSSVYYDYENDLVAIHYRVDLKEHRLRAGSPAKIKVIGFGRTDVGDFTFEASTPVSSDSSMRQVLERVIQKNVVVPLSTSGRDTQRSLSTCECVWKKFPANMDRSQVDGDHRTRRCAVSPGWTEEKYKINARPTRIDGHGDAFDMCEAQNAMIPTPGHRGVVQSGFSAVPALEHFGRCCCEKGPVITVSCKVAFSVTVRTRGDANTTIAGVIRISNDIEDIQASGGLTLGPGARGGSVTIGPVTVPILVPSSNPGTQLFFDNKVRTKELDSVSVNGLTGVWIALTANGYPLHAESQAELTTTEVSLTFRGRCRSCGRAESWKL